MTGYKRVSFYELCRLCASNTQKEKTHIFQDEGRKIQLQSKIQSCLALTVNENDFLPKVICSKCLRNLEICFVFRQECVKSESMLSTYFKNFRYTEDFKKSGKVYIKDTTKPSSPHHGVVQQNPEISTSTNIPTITTLAATPSTSQNIISINKNQQQAVEQSQYYALQFPTIVSNPTLGGKIEKDVADNPKTTQGQQNQYSYNINLINPTNVKPCVPKNEMLSNVVVNANGEVINIASVGDFETILCQGSNSMRNKCKKRTKDIIIHDDPLVKIDLTDGEVPTGYNIDQNNMKYEKLPHIKKENKYSYSLKIDDKNTNQTVIFSNSEYNQNYNTNFTTNNSMYTQPNINVVTNTITSSSNIICNTQTTVDNSSLNLNVLNQNIPESNPVAYPNVVSTTNSLNTTTNTPCNNKNTGPPSDNNNTPSSSNTLPQKSHVCEICLKSFKRREHLGQHIKLHTGFRPYICEQCQKSFMRKEHLMRHSTLHSGQKNYTCNICEKSFSRNDNLLKHKKTHDKQSSYTCEICQKHFVMKHYYNAHKLTHGDKCFVSTVWGMLKT